MSGGLIRNIRYALRGLARSPGFTSIVVLTLAVGIGANSAVFSVTDAVLLQPLPFPDGDRLVRLGEIREGAGVDQHRADSPPGLESNELVVRSDQRLLHE